MNEVDRIDIKEFREKGYLQELNRRFLHPLGLALEVVVDPDGSERLGGVWDQRHDPNGIIYAELNNEDCAKAYFVRDEEEKRRPVREASLGYWIQSL